MMPSRVTNTVGLLVFTLCGPAQSCIHVVPFSVFWFGQVAFFATPKVNRSFLIETIASSSDFTGLLFNLYYLKYKSDLEHHQVCLSIQ